MIEIRNLLFQPLTFQLAGEERGLHLGSRQRKIVEEDKVSEEIRIAAKRGFVALSVLNQPEDAPDIAVQAIDETVAQDAIGELQASTTADTSDTATTDSVATESLDETAAESQIKKKR